MTADYLRPAGVSEKTADTIMGVLCNFAERRGSGYVSFDRDQPRWRAGTMEVSLVQERGRVRVEVCNGDLARKTFALLGSLKSDLMRALEDLAVLGWAEE